MTVQTAGNLTGLAGVVAKYADNDTDPYDRATQLAAIAQYLNAHTHQAGMGAPVANLAANVNHSVNGLLNIWQRTVQAYTATGGTAGPDHLFIALAGTDTISCTQDTANRDSANGAAFSLANAFTLGTGGGVSAVREIFKTTTDNFGFLRGKTITRTWRIKSGTANAVRIAINTDGTGGTTTFSGFHTGDGTWQTISVTATIPTDATIINCDVRFAVSGTHYVGTHSTVIGSNAVDPYAVALSPSDDLARCQRYYQKHNVSTRWYAQATTVTQELVLPLRAVMAVSPTVSVVSGTRTNIAGGYPLSRYSAADGVTYVYAPTAVGDTYALNDIYLLEANP